MAKHYRSKPLHNIKTVSNHLAKSTGNLASKITTQAFTWATKQTQGNAEFIRRQSSTTKWLINNFFLRLSGQQLGNQY